MASQALQHLASLAEDFPIFGRNAVGVEVHHFVAYRPQFFQPLPKDVTIEKQVQFVPDNFARESTRSFAKRKIIDTIYLADSVRVRWIDQLFDGRDRESRLFEDCA